MYTNKVFSGLKCEKFSLILESNPTYTDLLVEIILGTNQFIIAAE